MITPEWTGQVYGAGCPAQLAGGVIAPEWRWFWLRCAGEIRRSTGLGVLQQIPQIAVQIFEHRDGAVRFVAGAFGEAHPGGGEGGMIAREIIGGEE